MTTPSHAWPGDAPYAFAVSFDLDRVRPTYHRWLYGLSKDAFWNFTHIGRFMEEHAICPTVFVLDQPNPLPLLLCGRIPDACGVFRLAEVADELRALVAQGAEIGIHGNWGTRARADLLRRQRERLAAALAIPLDEIRGNRQHYLDHAGPVTFRAEAEAGLSYDSSVGHNYRCGAPRDRYHPYLATPRMWEIPLAIMDTALMYQTRRRQQDPQGIVQQVADAARQSGGVLQICLHTHHFRPGTLSHDVGTLLAHQARTDGAWCATLAALCDHCRGSHE